MILPGQKYKSILRSRRWKKWYDDCDKSVDSTRINMDDYDALVAVLADYDNMQHYPYSFDEKKSSWMD